MLDPKYAEHPSVPEYPCDHDWGSDLESDTQCIFCGLSYGQWSSPPRKPKHRQAAPRRMDS